MTVWRAEKAVHTVDGDGSRGAGHECNYRYGATANWCHVEGGRGQGTRSLASLFLLLK